MPVTPTVTIGQVDKSKSPTLFSDVVDSIWDEFVVMNHYERDGHTYQLAVASPGGFQGASVAFVKLAAATLTWTCTWTSRRIGQKPIIPDPQPFDSQWVLLDKWDDTGTIAVPADGTTPAYQHSGIYIYGHINPDSATLYYARPPWLLNVFDRAVDPLFQRRPLLSDNGRPSPDDQGTLAAIPSMQ